MASPLVSVVMSVYNGEPFLRAAVESILDQSFCDLEFIIVNDGSTDRSAALLDLYQKNDPRVRVYHQENRGLIESLNRGLAVASGKYIARMDADDIAIKDRLKWQVQFMDQRSELGVLGGAVEVIDSSGQAVGSLRFPIRDRAIKARLLGGECCICHPTALIRSDAIHFVGGYRSVVVDAEDYDLWLRIADRFQLGNLELPLLKYRRHPNQISVKKFKRQALSNLAARSAALSRREGKEDFLEKLQTITPVSLTSYGVSEEKQTASLARAYLSCIQSMIEVGSYPHAMELMSELSTQPYWERMERSIRTDFHIMATRLHWRQRELVQCLLSATRALVTRPIIVARPLKIVFRRIGLNPRIDVLCAKLMLRVRKTFNRKFFAEHSPKCSG